MLSDAVQNRSGLVPLFEVDPTPIYKLSPPPKVGTERNLQNLRLNSTSPALRWTWSAEFWPNAGFSRKEEENPEN
jgi:hypothetical protein